MKQTQTMFLSASAIFRYLEGLDENLDTLITCKPSDIQLISTDQSIYEALGSVRKREDINYNKLIKLLEVCDVKSYTETFKKPRKILTEKRVEEVRLGTDSSKAKDLMESTKSLDSKQIKSGTDSKSKKEE